MDKWTKGESENTTKYQWNDKWIDDDDKTDNNNESSKELKKILKNHVMN